MPLDPPPARRLQLDGPQHLVCARVGNADGAAERSQMITSRAARMEIGGLKHRADRQGGTIEIGVRPAEHERPPARRGRQAEEHPHRGRLARTIRAEKARDRPRDKRERQVVHGQNRPESLRQRLSHNRGQRLTASIRASIPREAGRQDTASNVTSSERSAVCHGARPQCRLDPLEGERDRFGAWPRRPVRDRWHPHSPTRRGPPPQRPKQRPGLDIGASFCRRGAGPPLLPCVALCDGSELPEGPVDRSFSRHYASHSSLGQVLLRSARYVELATRASSERIPSRLSREATVRSYALLGGCDRLVDRELFDVWGALKRDASRFNGLLDMWHEGIERCARFPEVDHAPAFLDWSRRMKDQTCGWAARRDSFIDRVKLVLGHAGELDADPYGHQRFLSLGGRPTVVEARRADQESRSHSQTRATPHCSLPPPQLSAGRGNRLRGADCSLFAIAITTLLYSGRADSLARRDEFARRSSGICTSRARPRFANELEWARWAVGRWAAFPVDAQPRP